MRRGKGSARGILLAALSGSLASGAGYAVWYAALPRIAATTAATVQLAVPSSRRREASGFRASG